MGAGHPGPALLFPAVVAYLPLPYLTNRPAGGRGPRGGARARRSRAARDRRAPGRPGRGVRRRVGAVRLVVPGPDRITGRVFLREPLGLEDEVLVETADGARVKVVTAVGDEFPEGAVVGVDLGPPDLYLFSAESKETICFGID